MPDSRLSSCTILLLAGGRGQRMGGRDKGLIEWQGRPLIAWLHDVARPLTDDLLISCNRNQSLYAPYADRLVNDASSDYSGPLAGIRAGLAAARSRWMMVLPCDTPLIDRPLLHSLYAAATETPTRPFMLRRGQQWEPLFSVIPTALLEQVESRWQAGERSPQRLFLDLGAVPVATHEDDIRLANLNTPALLAMTEALAGTSPQNASSDRYRHT
ncbi:molybdenum cofactor guanylyltransferase MobA [Pseudomonas stutzeri]|uniref:molybdenum cofactor guanylyltransferase MobA n=1 Tax=Stutzerimonas stutzeri TaxID=316 RepID=UPI00190D06AF|nr:molybdenum cofactor guanylyltransferase MobA [Stutzerimonas stutzeri]MBK3867588.1 molybdenum cofactor guanylyltransferase MobA [Stutzerimonas stutzeri]